MLSLLPTHSQWKTWQRQPGTSHLCRRNVVLVFWSLTRVGALLFVVRKPDPSCGHVSIPLQRLAHNARALVDPSPAHNRPLRISSAGLATQSLSSVTAERTFTAARIQAE